MYAIRSYYVASIPQGTKILWACGERSATNINGIFQGELKQRFNMKIDILPIEHIMGLYNKDRITSYNVCYTKLLRFSIFQSHF